MLHGIHIYAAASDISMAKMFSHPPSQHAFPHWKCVLCCCYNFPCIDLPFQESDRHNSNTTPSIIFHVYHLIVCCKVHGRCPLDENKWCHLCLQDPYYVPPVKLYTKKELVMIETSISEFHSILYITEIKKIAFTFHTYVY